jgi:hypothetical protein
VTPEAGVLTSCYKTQEAILKIFYHGSVDKLPVANHTLITAPAGHLPKEFESEDWWDDTGERRRPKTFEVKFTFGQAEVPDPLGRYLIETGQAMKHRLVIQNDWNA